jgi:hypothetical protein
MSVFPKLNSLIGMPNAIMATPAMTPMAPITNSKIDIRHVPWLANPPGNEIPRNPFWQHEFWLFPATAATMASSQIRLHHRLGRSVVIEYWLNRVFRGELPL